jgi:phospholipase/lecithinase/hemolysin
MAHQIVAQVRKAIFVGTLPIVMVAASPQAGQAFSLNFSQTVVFGDSISDNGNLYRATLGTLPPSPPYAQRLSNGPVWVEYLASELNTPLFDYAIAGASTDNTNTIIPFLGGLQQQIERFGATNPQADPDALYIVFAGANDYLGGKQTNPSIPVTNLQNSLVELSNLGARNILVADLPDLGQLPGKRTNPVVSQGLSTLTNTHNTLLAQTLSVLEATPGFQANLIPLDTNGLFKDAIANPAKFGLTNVTDSCLNVSALSVCSNPDQYLFWDDIHPTTATHQQIAGFAYSSLEAVPEPPTTLGVVAFGLFLGAATVLKRKGQKPTRELVSAIKQQVSEEAQVR